MKLQLMDWRCKWTVQVVDGEIKRVRRHESAPGINKTRPGRASKWIKLTESYGTGPIDPQAPKQRSWVTESEDMGLVDSGVTVDSCADSTQ